jgi:hypothetical protein
MHLDLTPEALLGQLGYSKNEHTLEQIKNIIANTGDFEHISKHLITFNDALAVEKGYIAMSNSKDYFKIKCDEDPSAENLSAFTDMVEHWADKHSIALEKVEGKHTYYILGHK